MGARFSVCFLLDIDPDVRSEKHTQQRQDFSSWGPLDLLIS